MIKKEVYGFLSAKRIANLKEKRVQDLVAKGKKMLNRNIKQYEKAQKQLGGKTGKEVFSANYNDMKFILDMPSNTSEEQRKQLKMMRTIFRRPSYTVSAGVKSLKKSLKGVYGEFIKDYTQEERNAAYSFTGSVFANYSQEEIETIGSDEIVQTAMRFYNQELDYAEASRRAKISLSRRLDRMEIQEKDTTPPGMVNR